MDRRPIIPRATAVIQPTPSQLNLTDFGVVYTRNGNVNVNPSRPRMENPAASQAKNTIQSISQNAFFARLFKSKFRIVAPLLKGL